MLIDGTAHRNRVWWKAAAVAVALAAIVVVVQRLVTSAWVPQAWLSWALALSMTQGILIIALLLLLLLVKLVRGGHRLQQRRLAPTIDEALAAHAAGEDRTAELARYARRPKGILEDRLVALMETLAGSSRERISSLTAELGITQRWVRQMSSRHPKRRLRAVYRLGLVCPEDHVEVFQEALNDDSESVRVAASWVLVAMGDEKIVVRVFLLILRQTAFIRAVLASDLKPFAAKLAHDVFPRVVESGDEREICAALKLMLAWEVSLSIPNFGALLADARAPVRKGALRLARFVAEAREYRELIVREIRPDTEPELLRAALNAAGFMGFAEAVEPIDKVLRDAPEWSARCAAHALAFSGPVGVERLEKHVVGGSAELSRIALEALELQQTGRAESFRA